MRPLRERTDNIHCIDLHNGKKLEIHRCKDCDDLFRRQIDWEADNEHCYESNIVCPYCDYEYDCYDSYSYIDEGDCDVECESCGKKFKLEIHETVEFSTHKRVEDMPDDYEIMDGDNK